MGAISEQDVAALLEVITTVRPTRLEPCPASVLSAPVRLIRSDACVGYQEADVSGRFRVVERMEIIGEPPSRAAEPAFHTLGVDVRTPTVRPHTRALPDLRHRPRSALARGTAP